MLSIADQKAYAQEEIFDKMRKSNLWNGRDYFQTTHLIRRLTPKIHKDSQPIARKPSNPF